MVSKEKDRKTFEHLAETDIGFSSLFALRLDQQDLIKCLDIPDQRLTHSKSTDERAYCEISASQTIINAAPASGEQGALCTSLAPCGRRGDGSASEATRIFSAPWGRFESWPQHSRQSSSFK